MLEKYLFLIFLYSSSRFLAVNCEERRNKEIDETYTRLIPLSEVPNDCSSSTYGIVNDALEKCENFLKEDKNLEDNEDNEYEKFKCKHLRVHAKLNKNVCECEHNWKGSICNEYIGCPEGYSLHNGVCTPNVCQHDGKLAIGTKHIECTCQAPWDGRWCERLACWRMASKEHERRWRNAVDHCKCADGFDGENCENILFCKNGELANGRCECAEGFKGEICDRKCIPNQTCSATRSMIFSTAGVIGLVFTFFVSSAFVCIKKILLPY